MQLVLIRHQAPQVAPGICYGRTDLDVLPAELHETLEQLVTQLHPLPNQLAIVSSPLQRCLKLAQALSARWALPAVQIDEDLAEMAFGRWEMQPWSAIAREEIDAWAAQPVHYSPGGGENVLALASRIQLLLRRLRQTGQDRILVCHAGPIRILHALAQNDDLTDAAAAAVAGPHHMAYGSLVRLHFD